MDKLLDPKGRWYTFREAVTLIRMWRGETERDFYDWWNGTTGLTATHDLLDAAAAGKVAATERPLNGHRRPIDPLRFLDVEISWLPHPYLIGQDEPNFYDKRTVDRDLNRTTMRPAFPDPMFSGTNLAAEFGLKPPSEPLPLEEPPSLEPEPQPRKTRQPDLRNKVAKALAHLRPAGTQPGDTDPSFVELLKNECNIFTSPATVKRARAIAWPNLK
jgi:hypothetical protein